jgi:hypothetical protein
MSQQTPSKPTAQSPETQQLIDLCFLVNDGRMDVYPQLEAAVSQRQEALTSAQDSFFAGVESQPAEFQQQFKMEIDLITKYFESYDAALEQILKFKAEPKPEYLEESAHMLAFCSNGLPAAMSGYEQKYLSQGSHRMPLINLFTNLGKMLRLGKTSLEAWQGTCKQYEVFYTEALREVNESKHQNAAGVPERRAALQLIIKTLQELSALTVQSSEGTFADSIQVLADGHRDLEDAVAAFNQEFVSKPTPSAAVNMILKTAEGVFQKQIQTRLLRDLCVQQMEKTQKGISEMQMLVKIPHESTVIQDETPKALEAMEAMEEAITTLMAFCDDSASEEEARAAVADLEQATLKLLAGKEALDSHAEKYGKVLCPHCQAANAPGSKSCQNCSRVLPQMTGSEVYGDASTQSSFQVLEGEAADSSRDGVVTTVMQELFEACARFQRNKLPLEDFLALLDGYLVKTQQARGNLGQYHAPPVPEEATEEERAKAQEFIDLCAESLELLNQGVEECEFGLQQMRLGAEEDSQEKLMEGQKFFYEGSQKMWQVRRVDEALQAYIHAPGSGHEEGDDNGDSEPDDSLA